MEAGEIRSAGKNRREETIILFLRFGHTGLNKTLFITGNHNTGVETMRVYHMFYYTARYEIIQLTDSLTKMKVRLDVIEMLQGNSKSDRTKILL